MITAMKPDTYVITAEFADYDTPATATDYVSVVGRAYATARVNAACRALQLLRSDHEPANYVHIGVWEDGPYAESAAVSIESTYQGDYRGIVTALKYAEDTGNTLSIILK
jgi:hypothetical protein